MRILNQPLIHFLLLGGLLFAGHRVLVASDVDGGTEIQVGQEQLLKLLQFRARAFDRERFVNELDSMSEVKRRALAQEWLREEVLFREAQALQLDRDDYLIRQRLVQKLEFITRGFIESGVELDRDAVAQYFTAHRSDYVRPVSITFTHVFFSKAIHGNERARQQAQEMLGKLIASGAAFNDAPGYGDKFAYHSNYVERSRDYVAVQFDEDFARWLFDDSNADSHWQGPVESVFGYHLVLVAARQPGRQLALETIYPQVEADAREAQVQQRLDEVIGELMARYRVTDDINSEDPRS